MAQSTGNHLASNRGRYRTAPIAEVSIGHFDPLIRWAGSKRAMLPKLLGLVPGEYARYVEPFAGSAALYLNLRPTKGILGDINKELMDSLRVLRRRPRELHSEILKQRMSEQIYYELRAREPEHKAWLERATRFFVLNRYCFNGLYRTNRSGAFNVPYGPKRNGTFPSATTFEEHAKALRRARLVCDDFESVIRNHVREGDFVYIDPPYATTRVRTFSEYGPAPFSISDLERLKACLILIEERNATFVLSYADCFEARDIFEIWPRYRVRTLRNISGFSSRRRKVNELLFLSRNHPSVIAQ